MKKKSKKKVSRKLYSAHVLFQCTPKFKGKLQRAAKRAGISVAEYIRQEIQATL